MLNVPVVRYILKDGNWVWPQATGLPGSDPSELATYEGEKQFIGQPGKASTHVLLVAEDSTRILFQVVKEGEHLVIYLDPAFLPDGKPLTPEYAAYKGGGCLPVPPTRSFTLGPEFTFSVKP